MNLALWSIKHRTLVFALFLLLSVAGLVGFHRLPVANMPDLDLPTLHVALSWAGATPQQLETQIARPGEDALSALDGLKHIETRIVQGQVQIDLKLVVGSNLTDALAQAKALIDGVRNALPPDMDPPVVTAQHTDSSPILTYALTSTHMTPEELSWYVDDTVARAIGALAGVGKVERVGGLDREVLVSVDPQRLAAAGATIADLSRALVQMHLDSTGGRALIGGEEQSVRVVGAVESIAALTRFPVVLADGRRLRLDQVASVSDAAAPRTQSATLDGRAAVGIRVYRSKGADETQVASAVDEALQQLRSRRPDVETRRVASTVTHTEAQFSGSMAMLYDGALLAVFVVGVFLRNARATLIAALALPLSILPTFAAMQSLGFSLNTLTLLALAVVTGVLVDDAIVEIENVERHMRMGKPVDQAVRDAVTEIALPVIATTLTLVAIFLPTARMGGVPGLFFRSFGVTAAVAVSMSLLVARLLTPVLAIAMLRAPARHATAPSRLMPRYLAAVRWCLHHRVATLAAATAFIVGSVSLVLLVPKGFVPAADRGFVTINVEMAPGTPLSGTEAAEARVLGAVRAVPGVERVLGIAGGSGTDVTSTSGNDPRFGTVILGLRPAGQRASQAAIEAAVRERIASIPGARLSVGDGSLGTAVSVMLASADGNLLTQTAARVAAGMRGIPGLYNVASTASLERPEIEIRPDLASAAERGVDTAQIGDVVRIATAGDFTPKLAKIDVGDRELYLRVKLDDLALMQPDTLGGLRLPARGGGTTTLGAIARLSMGSGPAEIGRFDRQRYVKLSAGLAGKPLGDALAAIRALPAVQSLPADVQLLDADDGDVMGELSSGFAIALATGVACMYLLLAVLFDSFVQPLTILSALPLSIGGAFVALLVARSELDVPAMIGLVMLMGVVAKNSILLVEYANRGLGAGQTPLEAMLNACASRARAIIMTTVAMIAGMLPVIVGWDADASFRRPMALAVTGGLLTSTLLSLLVVPVVFACFADAAAYVRRVVLRAGHRAAD